MSDPYFIYLGYLRGLVYYLRQRQLPVDGVLQAMGLSKGELGDIDRMLPGTACPAAFAVAAAVSGDANIGLRLGLSIGPGDLGIVGTLAMTCSGSGELFNLHARFERLVGNGFHPEYVVDGEDAYMAPRRRDASLTSRHAMEFSLFGWLTLVRWLIRKDFCPTRVDFAYARPADTHEQEKHLGCPLRFDCEETRVYFPAQFLAQPLRQHANRLRDAMEQEARLALRALAGEVHDHNPVLAEVKRFVAEELGHGIPDFNTVADAVTMSPQRLEVLLGVTGTSYDMLVDDLRRQLAERYLQTKTLTLIDVALLLGFSEQEDFQQSVRRWFDTSPYQYRQQLRGTLGNPSATQPSTHHER